MTKANFPIEGLLPDGKSKFRAFKKIPIRAYAWKSKTHPNTYFISHYIHKSKDKLSEKDTRIVCNNWWRIEEDGDEC